MNHGPAPERASSGHRYLAVLRSWLWNAPYVLLMLAVLFWSGNFIVGRAATDVVPPVAMAFWRWTAGLVIVSAIGWRHVVKDFDRLRSSLPILLVLAALGISVFNTFVYIGLHTTTALNALLLQSAMPIVILVLTFLLFGERPRFAPALGVVISMAGVAAIASAGNWETLASLSFNAGDLWVLAAVGAYALYSVLLRKRPDVHPLSFIVATFALGALMLLPAYIHEHVAVQPLQPSLPAFLVVAYIAVFPGILSYLFFNRGVELAGANTAGHFIHLMPIFGSILALLLLGERIAAFHIVGGILIAIGLLLAALGRRS